LAGLLLAIPVSMATSRVWPGERSRALGLFLTPEEFALPRVLELLAEQMKDTGSALCSAETGSEAIAGDLWFRAVIDPCAYALHASLLPEEMPNRRRRHYLEGLIFQLQDEGPGSLGASEKRVLLSHRDGLEELHLLLWSAPTGPVAVQAPSPQPS
jgi:membrane glycosyltransferase